MAKVLLVDDERNIRRGIGAIISRQVPAFSEIAECSGGGQAFEELSRTRYDLVITDIRMPDMDGIELIRKIQTLEQRPFVVVISGYGDFSYAQEAIRYGAKAYLLKPIDRNELVELLERIAYELESRDREAVRLSSIVSDLLETRLRIVMLDGAEPGETDRLMAELGIAPELLTVTAVNCCDRYLCPGKAERNAGAMRILEQYITTVPGTHVACLDHDSNIVLVQDGTLKPESVLAHLERSTGYTGTAGTAVSSPDGPGIRELYELAREALKRSFLYPGRSCFNAEELPAPEAAAEPPVRELGVLLELLATERIDDAHRLFLTIFDESVILERGTAYLETLAAAFRRQLTEFLEERVPRGQEFVRGQEGRLRTIYEFTDLHEYLHSTWDSLACLNSFLLLLKKTYANDEIASALRFIQENYHRDITMAEVANSISMNYSYFSVLFKTKTGVNFVEYLRNLRIEAAKEFLRSSEYRIFEIAERVGFMNPKHFSTTFRTLTGLTPLEYRQACALERTDPSERSAAPGDAGLGAGGP
jgi:two-component system response regulator YesN